MADNTRAVSEPVIEPVAVVPVVEPVVERPSEPVVPLVYQPPGQMVIDAPAPAAAPMIGSVYMRDINLNFGPMVAPPVPVVEVEPVRVKRSLPRALWHVPIFFTVLVSFWAIPLY